MFGTQNCLNTHDFLWKQHDAYHTTHTKDQNLGLRFLPPTAILALAEGGGGQGLREKRAAFIHDVWFQLIL